ncbi:MAG: lipocalin family protein [Bacteroidales bacterium]|nr:lipocalin family protein [Bacteroidales bacterium]
MKRFFILTAILAVFGLSSCEKEPSKAIVGTWEAVKMEASIAGIDMTVNMAEAGMKMEFTFNEDGSGSIYIESDGRGERTPFDYSVNGNLLSIISDGETEGVPVSFGKNTMTVELNGDIIGEPNTKVTIHFQKV